MPALRADRKICCAPLSREPVRRLAVLYIVSHVIFQVNTHWHLKIKINQSVHSLFDSHIKPSNQFDSLTKDPVY